MVKGRSKHLILLLLLSFFRQATSLLNFLVTKAPAISTGGSVSCRQLLPSSNFCLFRSSTSGSRAATIARTSNSVGTAIFSTNSTTPINDGGKSITSPLVDSSLLRFLGTQNQGLLPSSQSPSSKPASEENQLQLVSTSEYYADCLQSSLTESTECDSEAESEVLKNSESMDDVTTNEDSETPWTNQFCAGRVSEILISKGADSDAALIAGRAVEQKALMRLQKRKIRRYLKNRDNFWSTAYESPISEVMNAVNEMDSCYLIDDIEERSNEMWNDNVCEAIEVLIESGLTGHDCAAILSHSPSIALMRPRNRGTSENADMNVAGVTKSGQQTTVEGTVERVLKGVLCGKLKLRRYDARKVLRACPGLLTTKGSHAVEQVVDIFASLGVSYNSLARDKPSLPFLLSRPPSSLFRLIAFLSSDVIRMPIKTIGPLIRRSECSELLEAVCPLSGVLPSPAANSSDTSIFVSQKSFNQIRRQFVDSNYESMKSVADTLRYETGVEDVPKLIAAYPGVLLLDEVTQIIPVTEFLRDVLNIEEEDVPKVLQSFPTILKEDANQMKKAVDYLLSLEVTEDSLGKIFRAFPSILTLDVETRMVPVVEFLQSIGVVNIGRFITRLPPVLGYSVQDELIPKWTFLSKVCHYDYFEVVRFPAYFSYPLEKVIMTRYEYLQAKGIPFKAVSVDAVLRFGDVDFATSVVGDNDGGAAYLHFADLRRKTRSRVKSKKGRVGSQYFLNKQFLSDLGATSSNR